MTRRALATFRVARTTGYAFIASSFPPSSAFPSSAAAARRPRLQRGAVDVDKLVKISIMVACLQAGLGVFYYYAVHLPGVEQRKIEKERAREVRRKSEVQACLAGAQRIYRSDWATECKARASGKSGGSPSCSLPLVVAVNFNKSLEDQLARCLAEAKLLE